MNINQITDLTNLDLDASTESIQQLVDTALKHQMAAVCVYPKHLPHIIDQLRGAQHLKRATVLNFPSGELSHQDVMDELATLIEDDLADEIDYVFPYQRYLAGFQKEALATCHAVYQCALAGKRVLKVILETGALRDEALIHTLSLQLIDQGCDFLKTSTGKIAIGATPEAARAILSAIKKRENRCGIKISGGIRSQAQALSYIHLAESMLQKSVDASWFRIGSSSTIPPTS